MLAGSEHLLALHIRSVCLVSHLHKVLPGLSGRAGWIGSVVQRALSISLPSTFALFFRLPTCIRCSQDFRGGFGGQRAAWSGGNDCNISRSRICAHACVQCASVCGSWACGRPTFGCCAFWRPTFGCLPSGSPACCLREASAFRGAGGSNFLGFFIKPPQSSSPLASPCVITPSSYCCPSAAKGLPGSLELLSHTDLRAPLAQSILPASGLGNPCRRMEAEEESRAL